MFKDASLTEIQDTARLAAQAFKEYSRKTPEQRSVFLKQIAAEIELLGDELLQTAAEETHLPLARLQAERSRTLFQLTSYADAGVKRQWMDIRIDTAIPDRNPPKPDLRKMNVPLGPVLVFGAANFPFAYSTAGGDTASALAAGCPVIVKAHPAHPKTSEKVAGAIFKAVEKCNMPPGVFSHLHGASHEVGKALIMQPEIKAVGFTGSFAGGKQLFDWANQRPVPIPVFAEMSSVNPVFLLPEKLSADTRQIAEMYAASITLGVGQFCTNPGLIIGIKNEAWEQFKVYLGEAIQKTIPAPMLHSGIYHNYIECKKSILAQPEVTLLARSEQPAAVHCGESAIAETSALQFLKNPLLHKEVFGPFSLLIGCEHFDEMKQVVENLEGQLTATIIATNNELKEQAELIESIKKICGRLIFNGVPTGVEVCFSMQHGGPFPATTDSRFGAVGADAIRRWVRPLCYQNWPNELFPPELKNENPLNIFRVVNNELTNQPIT
ncbi:MAG: aldehyde dehydrogenase (NADP(+)) [Chitinophagaceae bacterium]|nr:aldehyde dehydrogenase (NADP(+)) [Chitinophagaceae bacterium]